MLLLCDVLGFSAREAAAALEVTTATVTSALQRARQRASRTRSQQAELVALGDDGVRALAARYTTAWESGDVDAIVSMLAEDARYSMPPLPEWYEGRDAIRAFLAGPLAERWRFRPARANGQLAFATYAWDGSVWVPCGLDLLALRGGQVVGEHTLIFAAGTEHIALTHRAFDRRAFATGAVRAALWVVGKPPGLYSMMDVLGMA